jgi:Winged helix DNA-binding domain
VDIARLRLHSQRLAADALARPEDVVQWLGAVQAQDYAAAKWALAQRTSGIDAAGFDRLFDDGAILRTHILRPTWHFVLPADIRWMLELTAPRVHAASAYYYRTLGLDALTFARSNALLAEVLSGGRQLTRAELAQALEDGGVDASGLRLGFLLMHAELEAVVCSGARRGKKQTHTLLDDRVPKTTSLDGDEALGALAHRYFTSHGPAQLRDYCWWSGLTVTQAKLGIEHAGPRLAQRELDGKAYWFDPALDALRPVAGTLHLLPNFDEYLVAYKDRSAALDPSRGATTVTDVLGNVIVSDGQVIGEWRRAVAGGRVTIEAAVGAPPSTVETQALRRGCEDYGRFVGMPAELVVIQPVGKPFGRGQGGSS